VVQEDTLDETSTATVKKVHFHNTQATQRSSDEEIVHQNTATAEFTQPTGFPDFVLYAVCIAR
jgi:hypothetical protein